MAPCGMTGKFIQPVNVDERGPSLVESIANLSEGLARQQNAQVEANKSLQSIQLQEHFDPFKGLMRGKKRQNQTRFN